MGTRILAVEPLSRNDLPILAQLFETSFDYYIHNSSPFFSDYLKALRTVAGLGFSAVLADKGSLLSIYKPYLERFLENDKGDFKSKPLGKTAIAQSLAEMVRTSLISFSALQCPSYYPYFVEALYYTIAKIPHLTGKYQKEVERILTLLIIE
jgi:hypothetical protein